MFSRNVPLAVGLILFGILSILISFKIVSYDDEIIIYYVLIYFGVHSFYKEMNNNPKRAIIGIVSFMLGLILFVKNSYSLVSYSKIIFPSIGFTLGIIFLYLNLYSVGNKLFLFSGLFLILFSLLIIIFNKQFSFIEFINSTIELLVKYWYLLAIIIGFEILIDKKYY